MTHARIPRPLPAFSTHATGRSSGRLSLSHALPAPPPIEWPSRSALFIGAACLLAWPALTEAMRYVLGADDFYGVPFALAAVVVASWRGGLSLGLLVTVASVFILMLFLPETRVVDGRTESAWHILLFALTAAFVSAFQSTSKALEEKLRRDTEFKDDFLSLMSHEMRTPATIIYSGIRVLRLRGDRLSEQERDEVTAGIETEAERLSQTIEDILLLARLQTNRPGLPNTLVLSDAIDEGVKDFRAHYPQRELRYRADESACIVAGQARQLSAVLRHLFANAHAYSPAATPIIVTMTCTNRQATVSVRDYGPRLGDGELHAIFDPYYRGRTLTAGSRGIGLGLTLCRRVIDAMGGRLSADRPADGGLEVRFSLPCIAPA